MNLGVGVWLYNDEYLVKDCVSSIAEVFDQVKVFDIGSTDHSLEIVKKLGVPVIELGAKGKLDGKEYIDIKRGIHSKYDYVFCVDADEIYPKEALLSLRDVIQEKPPRVHGFWKMLKFKGDELLCSGLHNCGEIAWDTSLYDLRRIWPHEVLRWIDDQRCGPK